MLFRSADIARAILDVSHDVTFRPERHMMQFWSCMEEMQKGFGYGQKTRTALAHLIKCRDVTWSWRDPLPLLTMPWTARDIIKTAHRDRVPFGIAATRDLVWTGTTEKLHDPAQQSDLIREDAFR